MDEEKEKGAIDFRLYLDFFGFADKKYGGKFSILVVIGLHVLINFSTSPSPSAISMATRSRPRERPGSKSTLEAGEATS